MILTLVRLLPRVLIWPKVATLGMMTFYLKKRDCVWNDPECGRRSSIRELLMNEAHKGGLMSHFGELKTYEVLIEHFFWPHMKRDIHHIYERCLVCRIAKSRSSANGLYTPFLILTSPWVDIIMDFVLGLPRSKGGRDFIFLVVDMFSKMAYFILCHKVDDVCHVINLLFREVVRLHGLPKTIVLDRDSNKFGTKLLFSTTCHQQTNGQTKVNGYHILNLINKIVNSTTSHSSFELVYGFNSLSSLDVLSLPNVSSMMNDDELSKAQFLHEKARLHESSLSLVLSKNYYHQTPI
ncbi:hypothetical protein CR513_31168, partial [Mucuna pruriens]